MNLASKGPFFATAAKVKNTCSKAYKRVRVKRDCPMQCMSGRSVGEVSAAQKGQPA